MSDSGPPKLTPEQRALVASNFTAISAWLDDLVAGLAEHRTVCTDPACGHPGYGTAISSLPHASALQVIVVATNRLADLARLRTAAKAWRANFTAIGWPDEELHAAARELVAAIDATGQPPAWPREASDRRT